MALSSGLGARVRRREDPRLITGTATYLDDLNPPGLCHLAFVRSYLPHASIRALDASAARSAPGVLAVFSAADLEGLPTFPVSGPKGSRLPERPLLARGRVRFAGDLIALVVAASREEAADAAELVTVELDPLPAAIDPESAATP